MMKRQTKQHAIAVTLTTGVQLDERELRFLRAMAQHCIKTKMAGSTACERLDALLDGMGVKTYGNADGPTYGVFEDA
jgi:hypothetical protein